jgi:hypothetical protein
LAPDEIAEVKSQSSDDIQKDLVNSPQGISAVINKDISNSPKSTDKVELHLAQETDIHFLNENALDN